MGITTAIALGIAAAAKITGDVAAGKIQSNAAKKAAEQQDRGGQQAQRAIDSALGPYVNRGREVASTLGRLTAAPPGARFAAPDPTMTGPYGTGRVPPGTAVPPPGMAGGQGQQGNAQGPQQGTLGGFRPRPPGPSGGGGPVQSQMPQFSPGGPTPGQGGPMVRLRAPDGSIGEVPQYLAQQFIQRGATPVEGGP